jgi:predicted small lipoprotein YifL
VARQRVRKRIRLKSMSSAAKVVGAAVLLAIMLAGCGVQGALESPKAEKSEATTDADSGQGKSEADAPKEHKGFVLDGLLR